MLSSDLLSLGLSILARLNLCILSFLLLFVLGILLELVHHGGHLSGSLIHIHSIVLLRLLVSDDLERRTTVVEAFSLFVLDHHLLVFHGEHLPLGDVDSLLPLLGLLDLEVGGLVGLGLRLFLLLLCQDLLGDGCLLGLFLLLGLLLGGLAGLDLLREGQHVREGSVVALEGLETLIGLFQDFLCLGRWWWC